MRNFQTGSRFGGGGGGGKKFGGRSSGGFSGRDGGGPQMYDATCSDCGKSCEVPFRPTGSKPIYCRDCFKRDEGAAPRRGASDRFAKKDFGGYSDRALGRPSFDKEMFSATCAECGDRCEVPFKPNGEKPVYCRNCFKKDASPRSDRRDTGRFESRDFTGFGGNIPGDPSFDRPMYAAICSECGNKCDVPFKPNGEKPVYCDNCFGKSEKAGARGGEQYKKDFEMLNQKLDSVLRRLEMLTGGKEKPIPKAEFVKKELPVITPGKKKEVMKLEVQKELKKEKVVAEVKKIAKKAPAPKLAAKKVIKKKGKK